MYLFRLPPTLFPTFRSTSYPIRPIRSIRRFQMLQRFYRPLTTLALILTGALIALLAMQNATRPASGAGTLSPNVRHTILNVACEGLLTFGNTYAKIVDVGDFEVVGAESTIEL